MTTTQLKKKTKAELVSLVQDLQKQNQSLNDKVKGSRKSETTVKAFGKSLSLKDAAKQLENLDDQLAKEVKANIKLRNELVARDEFIEGIIKSYTELKAAIQKIKMYIEENQPYYFISFAKYIRTVKFAYQVITETLNKIKENKNETKNG